jgi:2-dehydropantoate 2-reductase
MHVVLVGPGALGSLLASLLGKSGAADASYTLIDYNPGRARELTSGGITYIKGEDEVQVPTRVSSSPTETGVADVVILCVKSYDVRRSLGFCAPLLGPGTLLLFMQNGIAHLDAGDCTGEATLAYGTTTEGATLVRPGVVRHAGKGLTQLGFLGTSTEPARERLEQVAALFEQAGLTTKIREDILSRLWTKLLVNTGINGLTAVHGCRNGELLTLPNLEERMTLLVQEAHQVATSGNIDVPSNSLEITREVCEKTATNISSMLQDVRSKRKTEIDAINGAVVNAARKLGIKVPENERLVREVKAIEQNYTGG